jgi:hypothetical protein
MTRVIFGWTVVLVLLLFGVPRLVNSETWSRRAMSNLQEIARLVGVSVDGPPPRNKAMLWSVRVFGVVCCVAAVLLALGMIFGRVDE